MSEYKYSFALNIFQNNNTYYKQSTQVKGFCGLMFVDIDLFFHVNETFKNILSLLPIMWGCALAATTKQISDSGVRPIGDHG